MALTCAAFVSGACRDPTQIRLDLVTDADCADVKSTSITTGKVLKFGEKPPSAETTTCRSNGSIGSLVVVPSDDKSAEVAIRVVTGLRSTAEQCVASGYRTGCIVARRRLRFLPHESLELPIPMSLDCLDVPCDVETTCVRGDCAPAHVEDPARCARPEGPRERVASTQGQPVRIAVDDTNVYWTEYDSDRVASLLKSVIGLP